MMQSGARQLRNAAATQDGREARRRLLAGMRVKDRRMTAAGISTTVLEAGDGAPVARLHDPGGYFGWPLRIIDDCADDPAVEQPRAFLDTLQPLLAGVEEVRA